MIKINWEHHTGVKCDFVDGIDKTTIKCSGIVNDQKNILEIGNVFKFGTISAKLIEARFNTENPNVWYEFENNKGGIL